MRTEADPSRYPGSWTTTSWPRKKFCLKISGTRVWLLGLVHHACGHLPSQGLGAHTLDLAKGLVADDPDPARVHPRTMEVDIHVKPLEVDLTFDKVLDMLPCRALGYIGDDEVEGASIRGPGPDQNAGGVIHPLD